MANYYYISGETRPIVGNNIKYALATNIFVTPIPPNPIVTTWMLTGNNTALTKMNGEFTFDNSSLGKEYLLTVFYTIPPLKQIMSTTTTIRPVAGKPEITDVYWEDCNHQKISSKDAKVAYMDLIYLKILTKNIPKGDVLSITVWEDEMASGHGDSSVNAGSLTVKVQSSGLAEIELSGRLLREYQKKADANDTFNDWTHEYYVQIKYLSKVDTIQDSAKIKVKNEIERLIELNNTTNKVVTIDDKNNESQDFVKTENIVIAASEQYGFKKNRANKLMFLMQAVRRIRHTNIQTVLYFTPGYTDEMQAAFEKSLNKYSPKIQIVKITTIDELFNYLNTGYTGGGDRRNKPDDKGYLHKVRKVYIYSHGLVSRITFLLGENNSESNELKLSNYSKLEVDSFHPLGDMHVLACRTGMGEGHTSDFVVNPEPEKSLAQKLANHLSIYIYAYIVRSDYGNTIGSFWDRRLLDSANIDEKFFPEESITYDDEYRNYLKEQILFEEKYPWQPQGAYHDVSGGDSPIVGITTISIIANAQIQKFKPK